MYHVSNAEEVSGDDGDCEMADVLFVNNATAVASVLPSDVIEDEVIEVSKAPVAVVSPVTASM